MGIFDEQAKQARARSEHESELRRWRNYALEAEEYFVAAELPEVLREFWSVSEYAKKPLARSFNSGEMLARVCEWNKRGEFTLWTDSRGRLWKRHMTKSSDGSSGSLVEEDGTRAFMQEVGWFASAPSTRVTAALETMDENSIKQAIRIHYENYLKSQL